MHSDGGAGMKAIKACVAYYKRSFKSDEDLAILPEVIIKNYRLRVVDAAKDLSLLDRRLMK